MSLLRSRIEKGLIECLRTRVVTTISHHAQIAWKRLSQLCSYGGPALPCIGQIACAVSLALTRSNLVAPGVIAFVVGEQAVTLAEAEHMLSRGALYLNAQDGHVYLTSFGFSLLECFILFLREIYLAILFTTCIAMAPFAESFGSQYRKTWLHIVHHTLEKAGPAFIKWGQWAATRPDLFARDLCDELAKLHTKAPAHNFSFTRKSIERAFVRKLPEIQISSTLKYRYPGQQIKPVVVAVKVRHPGVGEAFRRDFAIIDCVGKISRFIRALNWLRLDESIQQFAVFKMSQVDLSREAGHLSCLIYNFRSWKDVSFPRPLYPLVHPSVLVETYEQGESVLHYVDELEGNEKIKSVLTHIGTHALLKMFFKSRPHVIFLDVGMTAELSKRDRVNLMEFFIAAALRDGRTAAESMLRLSKQQNFPNPRAFVEEVDNSFKFWDSPEGEVITPADCMKQLLELEQVRRHKVNIDGIVCTVMVNNLVLEISANLFLLPFSIFLCSYKFLSIFFVLAIKLNYAKYSPLKKLIKKSK
ncbi:hypothetical protein UlMin_003304 [Ulmus minor]